MSRQYGVEKTISFMTGLCIPSTMQLLVEVPSAAIAGDGAEVGIDLGLPLLCAVVGIQLYRSARSLPQIVANEEASGKVIVTSSTRPLTLKSWAGTAFKPLVIIFILVITLAFDGLVQALVPEGGRRFGLETLAKAILAMFFMALGRKFKNEEMYILRGEFSGHAAAVSHDVLFGKLIASAKKDGIVPQDAELVLEQKDERTALVAAAEPTSSSASSGINFHSIGMNISVEDLDKPFQAAPSKLVPLELEPPQNRMYK